MPSSQPKVIILLATRNGAQFLSEQLESYRSQTYSNWELLISDDGSTDATVELVQEFAKSVHQRVTILTGPMQGFWQNFVSLVRNADITGDLFAYSDQDDVWFREKLARAVEWFRTQSGDVSALYFSRTELIEGDGTPAGFSPLFTRPPAFQNALVQNIGGGNTMVFNRAALMILRATPEDAAMVSHDWWTYQVVTGVGGLAHYDPWPSLKYRQHHGNLVGSNIGIRARLIRMAAFANGRVVMWNDLNLKLLDRMRESFTSVNAATLDDFANARRASLLRRLYLIRRSGAYRQSKVENIGLFVGALFGRL
ncbi:glycosyltransferase family 2 protein [Rhodopseudomonas boonkerdii]|uniref:glycosyltransferase family 2 protein n=1 Tax=Rhodopseudomonas boonkerdii TaxID=475937 RepID=UPI001E2D5BFD|nr:glycosyltransferase family 2 protein [Rhodopseudomonas boonkerdii]UGV25841.1 glycosyltransferase family 2 protein [Rhodopseudomonas boonkerdii]